MVGHLSLLVMETTLCLLQVSLQNFLQPAWNLEREGGMKGRRKGWKEKENAEGKKEGKKGGVV